MITKLRQLKEPLIKFITTHNILDWFQSDNIRELQNNILKKIMNRKGLLEFMDNLIAPEQRKCGDIQ